MLESNKPNSGSSDVSLGDAKPYRSPAEVSDDTKRRGLASPVAWLIAGFAVVGFLGALAVIRFEAKQDDSYDLKDVSGYVKDFGGTRTGRPLEEDFDRRTESDLAAQAAIE